MLLKYMDIGKNIVAIFIFMTIEILITPTGIFITELFTVRQ